MTKKIIISSLVISFIAEMFLFYLTYFNKTTIEPIMDLSTQIWLNALFNASSAILLIIAVLFIKKKKRKQHIQFIHFALMASALFLINYIFYHMAIGRTLFQNQDYYIAYYSILVTHLIGSVITLPLIFTTYGLGIFGKLHLHKKLAKITFFFFHVPRDFEK